MKQIFAKPFLASLTGATLLALSVCASARDLVIQVETLQDKSGQVVANLYDNAAAFRKTPLQQVRLPATQQNESGEISLVLHDVPAGTFAVMVFHDRNGDGKLARNFLGIPSEPYGFSGTPTKYGPPNFDEASFRLFAPSAPVTLTIKLK